MLKKCSWTQAARGSVGGRNLHLVALASEVRSCNVLGTDGQGL